MHSKSVQDSPDISPDFAQALTQWFAQARRPLPWRQTYEPYHVWVSEIMLQQTQMERGVAYFKRWMQRFPDVATLAEADEDEVLKLWEGLGYYSRARNLHAAARHVQQEFQGILPQSVDALLKLPGIGPYTANAIASIAFGQDVCVVDANVERVISRVRALDLPIKSREAQEQIRQTCQELLPPGQARDFNQALMELGSLVCAPRKPDCPACPLRPWCRAYAQSRQETFPLTAPTLPTEYIFMASGVLIHQGRTLVQKRMPGDVWGNLWEFPGGVVEKNETPEQAVVREYLEETALRVNAPQPITTIRHTYTRYKVTLHAFYVSLLSAPEPITLTAAQTYLWATWDEVKQLAFPSGHRQLVAYLDTNPEFQTRMRP